MSRISTSPQVLALRAKKSPRVALLRAFADEIRMAIVEATTGDRGREWTAAAIAAELDLPITTIYSHLAVLEKAGLLQVVATRMVRGIPQKRYAAAEFQLGFAFGCDLFAADAPCINIHPAQTSEVTP